MNRKKMNKTIKHSILIFLLIYIFSVSNVYGEEKLFNDVKGSHWASKAIMNMKTKEVVKGYLDNNFCPNEKVTYGEFIKMALVIQIGEDKINGTGKDWALAYYKEAVNLNIFTEYSIPAVKLKWPIPRYDMALILCNLMDENIPKENLQNMKIMTNKEALESILDINSESKNYYQIIKTYSVGILNGYPDGSFKPNETLSRSEAAFALNKILEKKESKKPNISDMINNIFEYKKEDWMEINDVKIISKKQADLKIRVPFNGNLASFDHNMVGFIYLIRNGEIIEYSMSIPADTFITSVSHHKLETIDYIMCIPTKHGKQEYITLVEKPFI